MDQSKAQDTTAGRRLIKSKERVKKFAEVFTPEWVVRNMVDMIYCENPGLAAQIGSTWLEPSCGDGNFLAEILRRKLERCSTDDEVRTACGSVFGIEIQADNVAECRARLTALVKAQFGPVAGVEDILRRNIVQGDFLSGQTADGEKIWFLD